MGGGKAYFSSCRVRSLSPCGGSAATVIRMWLPDVVPTTASFSFVCEFSGRAERGNGTDEEPTAAAYRVGSNVFRLRSTANRGPGRRAVTVRHTVAAQVPPAGQFPSCPNRRRQTTWLGRTFSPYGRLPPSRIVRNGRKKRTTLRAYGTT